MAPHATSPPTSSGWSVDFDTIKRDKLFKQPPTKKTAYPALAAAIDPHVKSFNQIFDGQLQHALKDIGTKTFLDGPPDENPNKLQVRVRELFLDRPVLPSTNKIETSRRDITPAECRERHATYRGRFRGRLEYRINDGPWNESVRELGNVPVMLRSNRCHLEGLSPKELVNMREESDELGGYFIVNGNEKLIRMLIVNRRNYPMAIVRPSFENRGPTYTKFATLVRSARPDQTTQTNVLHYLSDGNIIFRFSWRKSEYLVPAVMILKALVETNDKEIFEGIVGTASEDRQFVIDRVELLLRTFKAYNLNSKTSTRAYLGSRFAERLSATGMSHEEAGAEFLRRIVLPHLNADTEDAAREKLSMLLFMIRKLYALVEGECAADSPDSVQCQEVLLPGVLYGMIMKERIDEWLSSIGTVLQLRTREERVPFTERDFERDFITKVLRKTQHEKIGQALELFLSTGNLNSPTGLDLQQTSGYCVMAEKINFYRFISHFRMIHRGSFFAELKTTTVRKLLPESWGFLCPVHTPDGAPCGLLNHLAHKCEVVTEAPDISHLPSLIAQFGISQSYTDANNMTVQLDGRILGYCSQNQAQLIADSLRFWKVEGSHKVPLSLEVGLIPTSNAGQYPGLYISSSIARMIRPVTYLPLDRVDFVGPFEQPFMSIACTEPEIVSGESTHLEQTPTNILSIVANQTPFPDFNQSPRNMYQCLSADHEVLTKTGWKAVATVNKLDEVMTMNLESGNQQWNTVEATTRFAHDGTLYRLKSNGIDAVCNEDHRWYLNTKDRPTTYTAYTTQQMINNELAALKTASGKVIGHWDRTSSATTHINHRIPTVGHNGNPVYTWPECPWLPERFVMDNACNMDWCRFIGLVLGAGDITTTAHGRDAYIQLHQSAGKPAAQAYVEDLLRRLADKLPEFVYDRTCVTSAKQTWTVKHHGLYDFFLPMLRGPQFYNPLDDAMCRSYQAHHQHTLSADEEHVLPTPAGWKINEWWSLRRWFCHSWLYLLSRDQARAIVKGLVAADDEWCSPAQTTSENYGRDGASAKRIKLSTEDVKREQKSLSNRGLVQVFSNSIPLTHDLSVLGLLADTKVDIEVDDRRSEEGSLTTAVKWRISFVSADSELTVAAPKPEPYSNPRHDGHVYCLTVANGNFLARRTIEYGDAHQVLDAAQKAFYTGNCQMGKQTMGTPGTALKYRTDNKIYRLQTGQTPIVRPPLYNEYGLDNFPNGTNAVVAVISYTGYDMDDAMIINKSAHERGFGHGTIYKTKKIELDKDKSGITHVFGFAPDTLVKAAWREMLDDDGLPHVGIKVKEGDIIAAYHTVSVTADGLVNFDKQTRFERYHDAEEAFVEEVKIHGNEQGSKDPFQSISVRFRLPRSPVIGDKFSSRHGQKGVCSQKWPSIDMPFTESGIQPDVIINPHAFPSRMTIGMFVESLAGKSGALHGLAQDSTPFKFKDQEGQTAIEYFGHQLMRAGFNYHGNEPMYSGITGEELGADIYIGVVYYQRLRHMVNDKFQVRTTGPVTPTTGQPIKGRAKGGGIRVGEMERDALLAHGTAFLLQDRLMNCSDYTKAWICRECGSFLSTQPSVGQYRRRAEVGRVYCRRCSRMARDADSRSLCWQDKQGQRWFGGADTTLVAVPGVLRYLDVELAAMGIKMKFKVGP